MILGGSRAEGSSGGATAFSNPTSGDAFSNPTASPITGDSIFGGGSNEETEEESSDDDIPDGICVPNFAPGLKFWEEGSSQQICGQASAKCTVVYEKGLLSGEAKIVEGAECMEDGWAESANAVCTSLGDCGGDVNYNGEYSNDGYKWTVDGEEEFLR
jgi:hypothetical protein